MKNNNQRFLDLYKELESYLSRKYPWAESPIKEHYHVLDKSPVEGDKDRGDTLDILRILRNNLAHRNVDNLFEVSQEAIDFLKKEISIVKDPWEARDIMTNITSLYFARKKTPVVDIIKRMYDDNISHVPLLDEENHVIGIFSESALLTLVYKNGEIELKKDDIVANYKDLTDLNFQKGEKFIFVNPLTPVDDLIATLSKKAKDEITVIFVTQHGLKNEPLLGLITPWDILNKKKDFASKD